MDAITSLYQRDRIIKIANTDEINFEPLKEAFKVRQLLAQAALKNIDPNNDILDAIKMIERQIKDYLGME